MASNGSDLRLQRKRAREEEERREEEEEMDFIVMVVGFIVTVVGAWYHRKYIEKEPSINKDESRRAWLNMLYNGNESTCISELHVTHVGFRRLCTLLRGSGGLVATRNVTIEEIVALFLYILTHNHRNSAIKACFNRSGETISRQFHTVLQAVLRLGKDFLKLHESAPNEQEIEKWRWFENALGALDGTHIRLTVPLQDQPRFRNQKNDISTNVLGVCDANLKFIYVLPGLEGSASDSRVLQDALSRRNCFKVPSDKYYLVDTGYTNGPGFLAPYRGIRYHLNEWRGNTPTSYKELFNLRHSSARNSIERAFGLLKKRWAILRTVSFYNVKTQVRIINACCILHNFIRDDMPNESLLHDVDIELENALVTEDEGVYEEHITSVTVTPEWTTFRETLAKNMFDEYQALRASDY